MDRPSEASVVRVYHEIFGPEWSIQKLASSAIQGHLLRKAVHEPPGAELAGRSIAWKLLLAAEPPSDATTALKELRRQRIEYVRLLKQTMRAPDGTFPETLIVPGESAPTRTTINGMHELLAPILWALDYDSLEGKAEGEEAELKEFVSREYVPADAWALFSRIMGGAGAWYEWREPTPSTATTASTQTPWVAPINTLCNKIGNEYLKVCDPALATRLDELGIEPQMYGIRWLRLLFTREFSWRDALVLWDALFAADSSLQLAPWICVAMLMRIRNLLIPADYTTALTNVLRYPSPPAEPPLGESDPTEPHVLVQQALMLRANPVPATGATVVLQNRSVMGVPIEAPAPAPPPSRSRGRGGGGMRGRGGNGGVGGGGAGGRHGADNSLSGLAAFGALGERADVIAKGLWDMRGTVQNRVSEIRRNLPDLVRTPSMSNTSDTHVFPYYQSIASSEPEPVDEGTLRPPLENTPSTRAVRTRFEVEREVGDMKTLMRRLGVGVGVALNALKEDEEGKKEEALESLEYVQRVLSGEIEAGDVDPERVLGKTEYARRREEQERRAEREREEAERERVAREKELERQREEQERQREEQERQREEQERRREEQDPLQASPAVRAAPLQQTSPPRIRTTRAPWERSEHAAGRYPPLRAHTPPQPMRFNTPPPVSSPSPAPSPRLQPAVPAPAPTPSPRSKPIPPPPTKPGPSDPLGVSSLG
ncbi:hypothetical protein FRC07_014943 [Ceratobasidium sp. 392]|nr:hypothetical protein FRC07_014943 [Ceratobasidium sp. 392]